MKRILRIAVLSLLLFVGCTRPVNTDQCATVDSKYIALKVDSKYTDDKWIEGSDEHYVIVLEYGDIYRELRDREKFKYLEKGDTVTGLFTEYINEDGEVVKFDIQY